MRFSHDKQSNDSHHRSDSNQGGAIAQALRGAGFHLRGLTRKPDSERAAEILTEALGRPSGSAAKKWRQCWNGSIESGIARTSLAWNASSVASSRSSPIGHAATREQAGKETSHES
jgi:hypothetical protein